MFHYNFFIIKLSIGKPWEDLFGDIFMKYVKAFKTCLSNIHDIMQKSNTKFMCLMNESL